MSALQECLHEIWSMPDHSYLRTMLGRPGTWWEMPHSEISRDAVPIFEFACRGRRTETGIGPADRKGFIAYVSRAATYLCKGTFFNCPPFQGWISMVQLALPNFEKAGYLSPLYCCCKCPGLWRPTPPFIVLPFPLVALFFSATGQYLVHSRSFVQISLFLRNFKNAFQALNGDACRNFQWRSRHPPTSPWWSSVIRIEDVS